MARPTALRPRLAALLASTALVGVGAVPTKAEPLPTGGQVVSGGVSLGSPSNGALAIRQSSQSAIVNWQGFSVGQGHRVDIHQPNASAAILNRVTGATPSTIAGQLNANGRVYLVNPNGVTITRTGQVNAAGFVASSLAISDEDFRAGRRQFRGSGASAKVANHGTITIGRGGYAALIGGQVTNTGTIAVPMGRVGLGSGERATLDLSGDGFLQVAVPTGARGRGALVRHTGTISADGGSVTLSAAAARDMARQAVNLSGVVEARSVSGRNGSITLSGDEGGVRVAPRARLDASGLGGADGGRVRISGGRLDVAGTVDVSGAAGGRARLKAGESLALSGRVLAEGRTGRGGRVAATAPAIATRDARIDASGASGGGVVRVGGGRQGAGRLAHAERVTVDAGTVIRADALVRGDGGDVVVWSDVATRFAGTITARGGREGGDGGQAEVSSKGVLSYDGTTLLTAAKGRFGTLLLDPYDITIKNAADSNQSGFTATGPGSVIDAGTLLTALGSANVTVSTGAAGGEAGNITLAVGTPLSWNTGATLTLQAAGAVTLNSAVTAQAGGLTIAAGTTATATADLSVARFTLASGNWTQTTATLPGFATADFRIADGASFLRAAGGEGTTASPYLLTDIYGVQGMGSSAAYRAASYRLANDIDAAGTATWWGGQGFVPVGTNTALFTGSLDGAGHTIAGLTIARPGQDYVGLFGYLGNGTLGSGGSVAKLGLVGGSVSGGSAVGALAGVNYGGSITQSYATGSVSASGNYVGGLVGSNFGGSITQSYATDSVSASGNVGGLVGRNYGDIKQSYATGRVFGSGDNVGGLVGYSYNDSNITESYATGSVAVIGMSDYVGGLVGRNGGRITQSYATGNVNGNGAFNVGGLVGYNTGTLTATYWDKDSTGQSRGEGYGSSSAGVTGLTSGQARSQAGYTNVADTAQSFDFSTVWYQTGDLRPILRSEAAAPVGGVIPVSNLHQLQLMGANLSGSYRLTADLDATATASTAASAGAFGAGGFVPVGNDSTPFTGSLAGAGHTITGLTINRPSQTYVGLIGTLGSGGRVSGLGLVGGSVTGYSSVGGLVGMNLGTVSQSYASGSVTGYSGVGGLVGSNASAGQVSQSYASGSVSGSNAVGGLVGWNNGGGQVSQSYASGSVSGSNNVGGLVGSSFGSTSKVSQSYASGSVSGSTFVGGLVGSNASAGQVSQSYASGSVSGSNSVGGLVGSNGGQVSQSYASGSISGSTFVGGLVGSNDGTLTNTYWDTQTTGRANGVGSGSSAGATGLTTAQARSQAGYINPLDTTQRFDFGTVWYQAGDMRPILRSEAAAPVGGVIPVSNLHQLQLMGANLGASYRLTRDLDASATSATAAASGPWGAGGFVPVGKSDSRSNFIGSLDGAGHTITGLTIDRPGQSSVGLIGALGPGGSVSGLGLIGGSVRGSTYVGGLVGDNYLGTVSQSYASGSVSGSSYVGGLVGSNDSGTVSQSYASGSVTGSADYVGGLVGINSGSTSAGRVSQSYASGSVTGSSYVGGLVGDNFSGTVSQSYASGSVTGSRSSVGGLVGSNDSGSTVSQSYAIGSVTGSGNFLGGLVGFNRGTLTNTYWDTQTTGRANGIGDGPSTGATGLTTARMQDLSSYATNYALFDFATVWAPPNQAGQGGQGTASYPQLYALSNVVAVTPSSSRTYGSGSAPIASYAGLRPGDFVTTLGTLSTGATRTSDVGNYAVTASGTAVTSASGTPYRILYVPGTLTVTPATITVAGATGVTKTYDGSTALPGGSPGFTSSGVLFGDDVRVAGSAAYDSASAGRRSVLVSGLSLSGAKAGNYVLSAIAGSGTIDRATLIVTADPVRRTYGAANPALTGTVTGFVPGESLGNATTGTLAFTTGADTRSNVGTYAVTGSGLSAGNYVLVQAAGNAAALTVGPALLTVIGTKTYDATTGFATGQLAVGGGVAGETLTLTAGSGTAASADAGTYGGSSLTGLAIAVAGGNASAANYRLPATGTLAITPASVTVTARSGSSVYGDTPADPGLSATGLVGGQDASVLTGLSSSFGLDGRSAAGAYALAVAGSLSNGNYRVAGTQDGTFTIERRPLTVTAADRTKVYGDALDLGTTGFTTAGLVNGDTVGAVTLMSAGTAATATVAGGPYAIAAAAAQGTGLANYRITYADAPTGLTVTPRPVTLAGTRAYDAGTAIAGGLLTAGNLVGADTVAVSGTGTLAAKDVGTQALTGLSGLTLSNPNYTLAGAAGTVTITPATLTYVADPARRPYGAANPALSGTVTGFVPGESLGNATTGTLAFTTLAGTGSNVGTYAVTGAGLSAGNYVLVQAAANAGALTVDPALLTVTGTKTYDATAGFRVGQLAVGGGVAGETLTLTAGTGAAASADAGTYGGSSLTGLAIAVAGGNASAANYALPATGTLAITPAPVIVTARSGTSTYGDTPADPGLSATGLVGGQDVGVLTGLSSGFGLDGRSAAGPYILTVAGSLSNGNYRVAGTQDGTFTIERRPLTITALDRAKAYGDTLALGTTGFAAVGLVNGDGVTGVALASPGAAATATVAGGPYAITPADARGAGLANYAVTYADAPTGLTVLARPVTLSSSRVYDATAGIDGSLLAAGNLRNGDTVTVAGTGTLAGRTVGRQALADLSGLALSNPNYTLAGATGAVTITPATLTYTADPARRSYGAANPVLTGTVTGLRGADTLASATTGTALFTTTAGTGSNAGTYAVTGAGLSAGNYVLVQAAGNASALTVAPALLTVTGTKTYDATTGFGTGQLAVAGGMNGESLTLAAGTGAAPSADAGSYAGSSLTGLALAVAGGNGSAANYRLPATGTLAIASAPVIVTAGSGSSIYGEAPADPGLSATGLVGGQDVGVLTGLSNGFGLSAASAAGSYTLAVAGTLTNPNYRVTATRTGSFTIERRPLTITALDQAKTYGDTLALGTTGFTATGLVNGDGVTGVSLTSPGAGAAATVAGGPYAITAADAQGAGLSNYAVTYANAPTGLTVAARPVTLSGSRIYDATAGIEGSLLAAGNLRNGDTVTVAGAGTLAGSNVGRQAFADFSGLALSNPNYTLAGASGAVAITPATLTYTADPVRRPYGSANPPLTGTLTGFLGADTLADATTGTATFTSAAGPGSNVGRYAVTGSGLAAGNYGFAQAAGNATALTVDPALLAVTGTRTYDATAGFGTGELAVAGGVNGETVALTAGAGTTASAETGTYAGSGLTGLALAVTGGNGSAANYRLPTTGTLTITPASVTVRANDGRATYGDVPVDPGLSAAGLAPGEGVGVLTGLSSGFGLDAASAAGAYPLAVTGRLANPNYRVAATQAGTFTIERRPLVVAADPLTRLAGDPAPVLTYALGGRGLANGDRLTGALASTAGAEAVPGLYRITQGSLAAPADYVLGFVGAELAVLARPSRPEPVPVVIDATGLASTAERAARLDARPVEPALPLLLGAGPEGMLRVSDPRFDATLVCTSQQGGCFLAPLAPAPRPQAGLSAPAH